MSQDPNEQQGLAARMRTVTPEYFGRPDAEMSAIGWALFLGMVILLVPLLPFIAIVWAVSKLFERGAERRARRRE
ncbi:DUF7535 family protein [Halomarina pelagica]|uniref:DUF7535 family protein n=1 Tax=Halomarina pelagica TaxID=2961599 RepID=UPI0020C3CADC|nr:hypothetical protein [Halomarina sp. BND7]